LRTSFSIVCTSPGASTVTVGFPSVGPETPPENESCPLQHLNRVEGTLQRALIAAPHPLEHRTAEAAEAGDLLLVQYEPTHARIGMGSVALVESDRCFQPGRRNIRASLLALADRVLPVFHREPLRLKHDGMVAALGSAFHVELAESGKLVCVRKRWRSTSSLPPVRDLGRWQGGTVVAADT
jgi:hypothetical protein